MEAHMSHMCTYARITNQDNICQIQYVPSSCIDRNTFMLTWKTKFEFRTLRILSFLYQSWDLKSVGSSLWPIPLFPTHPWPHLTFKGLVMYMWTSQPMCPSFFTASYKRWPPLKFWDVHSTHVVCPQKDEPRGRLMQPLEVGLEAFGQGITAARYLGWSPEEDSGFQVSTSSWSHGSLAGMEGMAGAESE